MNKNGFTILELLATITIIAVISAIAIPASFTLSKKIKTDLYCEKVGMILAEAERWGTDHINSLKSNCYMEKKVVDFINLGQIRKESNTSGKYIVNPYNNAGMDNTSIYIYTLNKQAYAYYKETNSELINACNNNPTNLPSRSNNKE